MNLSKRERKLLILSIVIIITVSLFKWVILPYRTERDFINFRIQEQESILKRSKELINDGKEAKIRLAEKKNNLELLNTLVFQKEDSKLQLQVMDIIDQYLKEANLRFLTKDLQLEKVEGLSRHYFRLNLEGELSSLVSFLDKLEKEEKIYIVEQLDLRQTNIVNNLSIFIVIKVINREERVESYVR